MGPSNGTRERQKAEGGLERPWIKPEVGLVLVDASLTPIAFNSEAVAILGNPDQSGNGQPITLQLPEEILKGIQTSGATNKGSLTQFQAGKRSYICQAYPIESCCGEGFPGAVTALLLQRNSSTIERIHEVAAEYSLTEREREVLKGIAVGLSSKELAEQLAISPNTVKAYLRLIMVKMSVGTRAAILAKILDHSHGEKPRKIVLESPAPRAIGMGL